MLRPRRLLLGGRFFVASVLAAVLGAGEAEAAIKVTGSTTVNPVVAEAAEVLRQERGLEIVVDTQGGSSGGLIALGEGWADLAMSSRPVSAADRERYPSTRFEPVTIGFDAVALAVSRDVWEGGVRSLSAEQVRGIYEGRIRRWSQLGGPDRRIAFFNKEPGRGTWEVFAAWLYGDSAKAPLVSLPEVGSNEEARTKVGSTRGALTQLSAAWVDGETLFALAIDTAQGPVDPSAESLERGGYPLARSLLVVSDGEPSDDARVMLDFLLGPRGQELVRRHGYLTLTRTAAGDSAR